MSPERAAADRCGARRPFFYSGHLIRAAQASGKQKFPPSGYGRKVSPIPDTVGYSPTPRTPNDNLDFLPSGDQACGRGRGWGSAGPAHHGTRSGAATSPIDFLGIRRTPLRCSYEMTRPVNARKCSAKCSAQITSKAPIRGPSLWEGSGWGRQGRRPTLPTLPGTVRFCQPCRPCQARQVYT